MNYDRSGEEQEFHKHHSNFNKERFCKRNKLGGGTYGPHVYKDGGCVRCNKIDPELKRRPYEGRSSSTTSGV